MGEVVRFRPAKETAEREIDRATRQCERAEAIMASLATRLDTVIAELEHELDLLAEVADLSAASDVCAEIEAERAALSEALAELKHALAEPVRALAAVAGPQQAS